MKQQQEKGDAEATHTGELSDDELEGVAGGFASGGANFLLGDGSVRPVGLLLPAVQKAP